VSHYARPNILLLYTDQQRRDSLGCYGNPLARTPHLDRLAAQGVRFDHFYVQNPVCSPSRMSLLTGQYCSSVGIGCNGIKLPEDTVTITRLLRSAGYETAQIGKLHFWPHSRRCHRDPHPSYDFDTLILSDEPGCYDDAYIKWVEAIDPAQVPLCRCKMPPAAIDAGGKNLYDRGRRTDEPYVFEGDEGLTHSSFVASEVCRFLRQPRGKPFFCIGGFYAPHAPINPPQRFVDLFDPADMPLPRLSEQERMRDMLKDVSDDQWRKAHAYYLALCSHVDDCVGQILATLERCGLADDTIVIFTSDHGEYLGDHGHIGKGMPGQDVICRVAMLLRYPGRFPAGKVVDDMVEAVDWAPTMLHYAAVQAPRPMQGRSLQATIEGADPAPRDDILIESFAPHAQRSATVKTRGHTYFATSTGRELLYDRASDPDEGLNVATDPAYRDVLSDMRRRMIVRLHNAAFNCTERHAAY